MGTVLGTEWVSFKTMGTVWVSLKTWIQNQGLSTGQPLKSEPAQGKWFSQIIHTDKPCLFAWVVIFYEAHFECHDILMLGKSPIKWWQCFDKTIAVDWDVKHQFKQTNKSGSSYHGLNMGTDRG